jgi:hypothetical protein
LLVLKKHDWGKNFSTIDIGKSKFGEFYCSHGIICKKYRGYETKRIRESFGYNKINNKSADCFESHCSDSLALACAAGHNKRIEPGTLLIVDDTYRSVRRQLHYTQPDKNGVRKKYSSGSIKGLRKGLLIGTPTGPGRLCGLLRNSYRYYDQGGKRREVRTVEWISSSFIIRKIIC